MHHFWRLPRVASASRSIAWHSINNEMNGLYMRAKCGQSSPARQQRHLSTKFFGERYSESLTMDLINVCHITSVRIQISVQNSARNYRVCICAQNIQRTPLFPRRPPPCSCRLCTCHIIAALNQTQAESCFVHVFAMRWLLILFT